jgi:hypothetical protein
MQTEPSNADLPKRKRRWFQFSLRMLLISTLICGIGAGWLGKKIEGKRRERAAVETIGKSGGRVWYDYQRVDSVESRPAWRPAEPFGPAWLRTLLGENFFSEVEFAAFPGPDVADGALESLKDLPRLQFLYLGGATVSDTGLTNLKALTQLQGLELHKTRFSDAEVKDLKKALPNCKIEHW